MHYEMLVEDLKQIEEGHVPLPNYRNVPSKGYNYMEEERRNISVPKNTPTTTTRPHSIPHSKSLIFFHHPSDLFTAACKLCLRHRQRTPPSPPHLFSLQDFGFGSAYEAMTNPSPGTSLLIVTSVPLLGRHLLSPGPCFHLCSTARAVELLPFVLQVLSFSAKFLDEAMKVFKARIMELALFNCLLRTIVF
ncbi:hypothetical protein AHAS_Ahas04G0067300 [Arachis hypogaea]